MNRFSARENDRLTWRRKILAWRQIKETEHNRANSAGSGKLRDLAMLFTAARAIPMSPSEISELLQVRRRWMRIKRGRQK
jgi:hypothetical protein